MAWVSKIRGTSSGNFSMRGFGACHRLLGWGASTLRWNFVRNSRRNTFPRSGKEHAEVDVDPLQMLAQNTLTLLWIPF
jgi:hypothetical protein